MAQESKYSYDEESVKAIVHWALTPPASQGSDIKRIGTHHRYVHVRPRQHLRHQPALSGPVLQSGD